MELKTRQKHINNILSFYSQLLIDNPEFDMTVLNDTIYKNVVRWFDTEEEQQHDSLKCGYFNDWSEYFENDSNININNINDYFIQFVNNLDEISKQYNCIKVYIPLKSTYIKDGVIKIFNFISSNNITFEAKIGKDTRLDNIVIRVTTKEDAEKIISFINEDEELLSGLLPSNPFTFNEKEISIVFDGRLSYNLVISNFISLYLNELKDNNELEKVDYQDFAIFVYEYYTKTFIEKINTNRIYKDFNLENINIVETAITLKNISNLFIQSLNPEFTFDNFIELYNQSNDIEKIKLDEDEFYNSLIKDKIDTEDIDELIAFAINTMNQNESNDESIKRINMYLDENNICYIPRIEGLREYLINNNFRYKLIEKLSKEEMTLIEYLNSQMEPVIEETVEIEPVEEIIEEQVNDIEESNPIEEIEEIEELKSNEKEEFLKTAILTTYYKYDKKYNAGEYPRTGKEHIFLALLQLVKKLNYDGFTLENNCRQNLMENVSPDEVEDIIRDSVKLREISIEIVIRQYIDKIINNI